MADLEVEFRNFSVGSPNSFHALNYEKLLEKICQEVEDLKRETRDAVEMAKDRKEMLKEMGQ